MKSELTLFERFTRKIHTDGPIPEHRPELGPCWLWTGAGASCSKGYGRFDVAGRLEMAHRMAWKFFVGEIPAGFVVDHLCRNHGCVRPDHLEPVTNQENIRRGEQCNRTSCPKGHPYSKGNVLVCKKTGSGRCRKCNNARLKAYKLRRREA